MAAGNYYRLLNCSIVANLLLLLLLPTIYTRAAGASNSSTVMMGSCRSAAECATAAGGVIGEDPMMMDSETNNRLLESATGNRHFLTYRVTGSPAPACKGAVHNSCLGEQKYGKKKCGVYHRTCGGGSG